MEQQQLCRASCDGPVGLQQCHFTLVHVPAVLPLKPLLGRFQPGVTLLSPCTHKCGPGPHSPQHPAPTGTTAAPLHGMWLIHVQFSTLEQPFQPLAQGRSCGEE